MLNKYGLKMNGIKKAAGETKDLRGFYARSYVQISYDVNSGEVLAKYHDSANSFMRYDEPGIIHVMNAHNPISMQYIADMIDNAMKLYTGKAVLYMEG